jgi:hypothetical protein
VGAAIGEPHVAVALALQRLQRLLDRLGALVELLRPLQPQVAAAVDADVAMMRGAAPQPLSLLAVARELRRLRRIVRCQQVARPAVGMRVEPRDIRPQEQGAGGAGVEELPVVARDHHRDAAGAVADPVLEHAEALEIEMVGRLVEQQQVRLGDPGPRDQGQALPAAAECRDRPLAHCRRRVELVERQADLPRVRLPLRRRQGAAHRLGERQIEQGRRHVLLDEADAQAPAAGDLARSRLGVAGEAAQQGRLAGAVARDQADAVAVMDGEIEVLEEEPRRDDAEGLQLNEAHDVPLIPAGRAQAGRGRAASCR